MEREEPPCSGANVERHRDVAHVVGVVSLAAIAIAVSTLAIVESGGCSASVPPRRHAEVALKRAERPRLVDLAATCAPCKAMAPILEELRAEYAGRIDVQLVDVGQSPDEAARHAVQVLPTQIFFAADGR